MTFDQLMAEGAAALEEAGIVNARLESRWLLAHVTGNQPSELISRGQDNVPEEAVGAFRNRVSRRAGREPIQHILGTTEFYGLEFLTDARAAGAAIISGYELFFWQGVHAWAHFSGKPLDERQLRAALASGASK